MCLSKQECVVVVVNEERERIKGLCVERERERERERESVKGD